MLLYFHSVALCFSFKVIQTEILEPEILAYCWVDKLNLADS